MQSHYLFLLFHVLIVGALSLFIGWIDGSFLIEANLFTGFLIGAALSVFNSIGLITAWPRILAKKSFALAIGLVVSKFALSIGVIYWVTRPENAWFALRSSDALGSAIGSSIARDPIVGFLVGLGSVVPSAIATAFWGDLRWEQIRNKWFTLLGLI